MKFLKDAWHWLDGKKTVIGSVALVVADYLPRHTIGYAILSVVGQVFGATGILHKADKSEKLPQGLRKISNSVKSLVRKQ